MPSIQTVQQVPTRKAARGRDRDGLSLDVRWMLDAQVCEEKPVAKPTQQKCIKTLQIACENFSEKTKTE